MASAKTGSKDLFVVYMVSAGLIKGGRKGCGREWVRRRWERDVRIGSYLEIMWL